MTDGWVRDDRWMGGDGWMRDDGWMEIDVTGEGCTSQKFKFI